MQSRSTSDRVIGASRRGGVSRGLTLFGHCQHGAVVERRGNELRGDVGGLAEHDEPEQPGAAAHVDDHASPAEFAQVASGYRYGAGMHRRAVSRGDRERGSGGGDQGVAGWVRRVVDFGRSYLCFFFVVVVCSWRKIIFTGYTYPGIGPKVDEIESRRIDATIARSTQVVSVSVSCPRSSSSSR